MYNIDPKLKVVEGAKDAAKVLRRGLCGLFWSLQCYHFFNFEVPVMLPFSKILERPYLPKITLSGPTPLMPKSIEISST